MKIRKIKELEGTDRHVIGNGFESIRVLLESDNMGFSLHKTIIPKGGPYHWHYKNHLESCYCVKGSGIIHDLTNNTYHPINVDTTYILDNNDDHTFQALDDTVLISVFNPPVTGGEIHGEDGSYSIDRTKINKLVREMIGICNSHKNDYDMSDSFRELLIKNKII